ncbi:hypothetical protein M8J76_001504 [Diaphorina citri]|nr:hypothetical protein M8J76_001504 [Diaphorina citri]
MHLHFERNANSKCDCNILSLSWIGKDDGEGWKLNRTSYYNEGWLATGNVRGIVGVTYTSSLYDCWGFELPQRTNYNLRGHRSEVMIVKWNEPYQKLASCDASGVIFVWIKYEGRWSIELINDRNTRVTHFSWSHDGRLAVICYQDGFVLVGTVQGQRISTAFLNLIDSHVIPCGTITCGVWTPDDELIYFGTSAGHLIVTEKNLARISDTEISNGVAITCMSWSCEKFKMEDGDDKPANNSQYVIAIGLANGIIVVMRNYEDFANMEFHTGLYPICLEWSNSGALLCVAGSRQRDNGEHSNVIKIYSISGHPVTALTWGHNDRRIFVATGPEVHIAWVSTRISSLQLICSLQIYKEIAQGSKQTVYQLPLPNRIRQIISKLFMHTIRCPVPVGSNVRDFVSRATRHRLHCTMLRHDDNEYYITPAVYTLYLEYFGGLVPLLKGKRISKIKPDFVIYDPQVSDKVIHQLELSALTSTSSSTAKAQESREDSDVDEGCASPRLRRKRAHKPSDQALNMNYVDTLPEESKLAQVVSNLWGTKFRIVSTNVQLPHELGQIIYKTSLLHLQPRQMTLVVTGDNNTHQIDDGEPLGPLGAKDGLTDTIQAIGSFPGEDDETHLAPSSAEVKSDPPVVAPMLKSRCKFQTCKVQSPVDSTAKPYCEDGESSKGEPVVADIKINRQVVRSCSAGYLDLVETENIRRTNRVVRLTPQAASANKTLLSHCGKSRSLDSSDIKNLIDNISFSSAKKEISPVRNIYSAPSSPTMKKKAHKKCTNIVDASIKCLLNSPMLQRRRKNTNGSGNSRNVFSEERSSTLDSFTSDYKDLETFQKCQMKKKMSVSTERREFRNNMLFKKEFIMQNKAPMWNETSQVYQLDFGGRVTQESAKNFQVMQFGRIDYNAYTLDFQYPFSAVQAFAVALANITQRLK